MEEEDEAWVHVFLRFALDEIETARCLGAPMPVTEREAKGVVQGILQHRNWPAAGPEWMARCLRDSAGMN